MPRPKAIDKGERFEVHMPKSLCDKVRRELYSDIEGRVPFGAISELYIELTTQWLEGRGIAV